MPRRFHVGSRVEIDRNLIVFTMTGEIDTPALVNQWIQIYSEIAEPWRYDRLFDYRRADGIVDYDELGRFAAWWEERTRGIDYISKVAVVVNNALDAARVSTVRHLYPRDIRQAFMTLDEALDWLSAGQNAAA